MIIKNQIKVLVLCLFSVTTVMADNAQPQQNADDNTKITVEEADAIDTKQFRFAYDPSITEARSEGFYDTLIKRGLTEDAAIELSENIGPEFFQGFADQWFPGAGFKADNVADVMAMQLLGSLVIAKQMTGTPLEGDIAVRNGIKQNLNDTGTFRKESDRQKQEYAESVMLELYDLSSALSFYLGNNKPVDPAVEWASTILARHKIEPGVMTVDKTGLVMEEWVDSFLGKTMNAEDFKAEDLLPAISAEGKKQHKLQLERAAAAR